MAALRSFDPVAVPYGVNSTGAVAMTSHTAGAVVSHARPKGRKAGPKDAPKGIRALLPLGDGRLVAGYLAGQTVASPRGLLLLDGTTIESRARFDGIGPAVAIDLERGVAAAGGRFDRSGYQCVDLVDFASGTTRAELPLHPPLAVAAGVPIARSPNGGDIREGDAVTERLESCPWLRDAFDASGCRLLAVDVDRRDWRVLAEPAERPAQLTVGPDGTLFDATQTSVGATDPRTGVEHWRREVGRAGYPSPVFSLYALAVSDDGALVAAGGIADDANGRRNLVVLDAASGEAVLEVAVETLLGDEVFTSVQALAWHSAGWLAVGTARGDVVHLALDGTARVYRASKRGVRALAFTADGSGLVAAGTEPGLRLFPLLDDERG